MSTNRPSPAALTEPALLATRVAIGGYFLLAGFGKVKGELANGLGSFARSDSFGGLQPAWLPDLMAMPYGFALPWAEVVIGLSLMAGLATRISAGLTAAMLASFTIALVTALGLSGGSPGPFHPNFVMLAAVLVFAARGGGSLSVDAVLAGRRATGTTGTGAEPATAPA